MTEDDLKKISDRAEGATTSPWIAQPDKHAVLSKKPGEVGLYVVLPNHKAWDHDVEFIAHARTDVPALVAEVRRLKKEVDGCRLFIRRTLGDAFLCRLNDEIEALQGEDEDDALVVMAKEAENEPERDFFEVMKEIQGEEMTNPEDWKWLDSIKPFYPGRVRSQSIWVDADEDVFDPSDIQKLLSAVKVLREALTGIEKQDTHLLAMANRAKEALARCAKLGDEG